MHWLGMYIKLSLVAAIVGVIVLLVFLHVGAQKIAAEDDLRKANAIVAISGGNTKARTLEAVRLYQNDWAPLLIFSGAAADPDAPSNAEQMREIAIENGVPPDAIVLDHFSTNTQENAAEVSVFTEALHIDKVILVTSPYHQARASIEFEQRLEQSIEIINHPAPDIDWSPELWWSTPRGWYLTVTELPKTIVAWARAQLME